MAPENIVTSIVTLKLSVLDLIPVRTGQTSRQAIAASMDLVQKADAWGYHRYWFAEHHNMPAIASSSPPVLIAAAAGRTERIRLGSGGVMLPNHSPLVVAEQFAALEAIAPGRIDLGIGRAPGSDPVITQLLRRSGTTSEVEQFPRHIEEISALTSPAGATLEFTTGGEYTVRATPAAENEPEIWLLGSSDYSAVLAAKMGMPYVFAAHFGGEGLQHALSTYRTTFVPSERLAKPKTFLTANASVAPTAEEAFERAIPQMRTMVKLRTGRPLGPQESIEQSMALNESEGAAAGLELQRRVADKWFIGTPDDVHARLLEYADRYEVGEIMISPIAGAYEAESLDTSLAREQTLELLAPH